MTSIKDKIYQRQDLAEIIAALKQKGYKIGLTNGVFDLVHAGHAEYLENAKKLCDILVVSINTDASVREYKGSNRPINTEVNRARVIAGFASVDFVTFHPERRMEQTLLVLKPDYYIKGEDYSQKTLTSANVLKQWGGKPVFVPFIANLSSTKMIETILHRYVDKTFRFEKEIPTNEQKAIILDRDGVINKDIDYLHSVEKLEILPNVIQGITQMQKAGYKIVIITNQAGIGLGYFTEEDFYRVNKKMLEVFSSHNILISKIYFCPHNLSDNCSCRKPSVGLFERAKNDLHLNMQKSWTIGDKRSDIIAGKKMKAKTIMINLNNHKTAKDTADFFAKDLLDAAMIIERNS